jgi:hypothetical protein
MAENPDNAARKSREKRNESPYPPPNTGRPSVGANRFGAAARWFLLWCVLLAALAALRSHTFIAPQAHDEAVFLYAGQAWAAGQTAYRDFWDHKPPNIFLFHSLPLRLFAFSRPAVLVNELLWLALAATLFAAVCRLYLSRTATFVALAFFCLYVSENVTIRTGGLTEESALTFVALSYLMILRPSPRLRLDALLAGLFLGIAMEFRQTFGASLLFLILAAWWRSRQFGLGARITAGAIVLTGVGLALPELFWSGYFAVKGVWWEYLEGSYVFNLFYISAESEKQLPFAEIWNQHLTVLLESGPMLAAPALALALLPWLRPVLRGLLGLLLVALVCEFAPVSLSREFYPHYYIQAAVSSCLLLGLAAETICGIVPKIIGRPNTSSPSAAMLAAGGVVGLAVIAATAWLTVGGVQGYIGDYRRVIRRNESPTGDLARERSLADAIDQLTAPDETILLLGVQPNACYFVSRRYAGARYYHNSPLFKGKFQKRISAEMQQRMLDDLGERRPVLILLGLLEGSEKEWLGMELINRRAKFLRPYLDGNYVAFETLVSEIPSAWFWYQDSCGFLVRKDAVETIRKRFEAAANQRKK